MGYKKEKPGAGWVLFFSSLPTKPVNSRMKIWRRLTKAGAIQIKNSAYILPWTEEHVEFYQWLVSEVVGMKGEAAFVRVQRVDMLPDEEIVEAFRLRKRSDYQAIERTLDTIERRLDGASQGGKGAVLKKLSVQISRLRHGFEEAQRTDFFPSGGGGALKTRIALTQEALNVLVEPAKKKPVAAAAEITRRSIVDYQGRTWATRRNPFVDRMASAWLVRRFIDPEARFVFLAGKDTAAASANVVTFDVQGGHFTHAGDLCTFEVLLRSFDLKDPALAKVAQIVHDLDVRDDRYHLTQCAGIEEILVGIRNAAHGDDDALERGMALFEALYAAKKK